MAAKLISLRDVPDEEAKGIRELLDQHRIGFYETPAGNWGISAAIIWIEDELQLDRAKTLLETFQQEWTERERAAHAERVANKQQPGLLMTMLHHPIRTTIFVALAAAIAYISIMPFINLSQ